MAIRRIKVNNLNNVLDEISKDYPLKQIKIEGNTIQILVPTGVTQERVKIGTKIVDKFENGIWRQPNKQRSGSGSIPIQNKKEVVKIEIKELKQIDTGLDPANVVPSIVNKWISPNEMVKNILSYINNKNSTIPKPGRKELERIIKLTTDTKSTISYDPNASIVTSEFFEALSSIRLCSMLEDESRPLPMKSTPSGIRKVFGIPNDSELGDFKIFFPIQKGFPLVDFFVNIYPLNAEHKLPTGNPENFAGDGILRISVKNITKSSKVNTVKFDLAFGKKTGVSPGPNLAEMWYRSLKSPTTKQKELAQKIIAKEVLRGSSEYNRNKKLAPLVSIKELCEKHEFKDKIKNVLDKRYKQGPLVKNGSYIDCILKVSKMISDNIRTINQNDNISKYVDGNFTSGDLSLLEEFLDINFVSKSGEKKESNFKTLSYAGDKIFEWATNYKDPAPEWNFYKLFYDKVLCERDVVYAITSAKGKILKYSFYSKTNYQNEYHSWIGLRSKGTDQLGMG